MSGARWMLGKRVVAVIVKSLHWTGDRSWDTSWFKYQPKGAKLVQSILETPLLPEVSQVEHKDGLEGVQI